MACPEPNSGRADQAFPKARITQFGVVWTIATVVIGRDRQIADITRNSVTLNDHALYWMQCHSRAFNKNAHSRRSILTP